MEEILKILKANGVFFLATTGGTARRVRPFGFAEIMTGRLYFFAKIRGISALVAHQVGICSCSPLDSGCGVR